MKYKVFLVGDKSKTDLNAMTKKQRKEYLKGVVNPKFVCECGAPLLITKDYRFVDVPHCGVEHKEDCDRHKDYSRLFKKIEGPIKMKFPKPTTGDVGGRTGTRHGNPNGDGKRVFESLSFVIKPALDSYNRLSNYNSIIHDMLDELKKQEYVNKNNKPLNIEFFIGKMNGIIKNENDFCIESLSAAGKQQYDHLKDYEYRVGANLFNRTYNRALNSELGIMCVVAKTVINNVIHKNPYFLLVTKNGLICQSFLEQRVYSIIEDLVKENRQIRFVRSYKSYVYPAESHMYIEDGILELKNNTSKFLVIEIFGMNDDHYLTNRNRKTEFLKDNNIPLLAIETNDNDETVKKKVLDAIKQLTAS